LAGVVQWSYRDYPGKVKCLSDEWFAMMNHAAGEADRLGLRMSLFICPGWSHCGGPWIKPDKGLKLLVASRTTVTGPARYDGVLPRAPIHKPMGEDRALEGSPDAEVWKHVLNPGTDFYRDVAVLAVPVARKGEAVPVDGIIDLT